MKRQIIGIFLVFFIVLTQISYAKELDETEIVSIAQKRFEEVVPMEYQNEYRFLGASRYSVNPSHYYVLWGRFVNNILVDGDEFALRIDANTGQILKQTLDYTYPASELDTAPSISKDQITWFSEKYGDVIDARLFIMGKELYWYVEFKDGFAEFDADTGKFVSGSTTTGDFQFDTTEYYLNRLGMYAPYIGTIAVIGGLILWKRKTMISALKR